MRLSKFIPCLAMLICLNAFPSVSHGVELKTSGELKMNANFWTNMNFSKRRDSVADNDVSTYEDAVLWERLRLNFDFLASEQLKAYTQFEIGEFTWGNKVGAFDTDEVAIEVPRAMLQYTWPHTDITISVGKFELALPESSYFGGSPIFDENITAFVANVPLTDSLQATMGYARALDVDSSSTPERYNDDFDFLLLSVPIHTAPFHLTPFAVYSWLGKDSLDRAISSNLKAPSDLRGIISAVGSGTGLYESSEVHPWWAGTSLETDISASSVAVYFDFNYGHLDDKNNRNDRKGWFTDFALAYTGVEWAVPSVFFAYGSGMDDKIDNGDERMPYLDENWDAGTAWTGCSPTLKSDIDTHPTGAWYLGAKLSQVSWMENLTHDFVVAYYRGTNHQDMAPYLTYANDLTAKDSVFEADTYTYYDIYQELTAIMEFGVLFPDYDKEIWKGIAPQADAQDTAWKVVFGLKYSF
jgi:hypothetical protein